MNQPSLVYVLTKKKERKNSQINFSLYITNR